MPFCSSLAFSSIRSEVHVASVAPEEIHEALVVGVGHVEQADNLLVIATGLGQTATDDGLDLPFRDH